MKDKKYFCYEIYKNLAVWSHNGRLGYNPCSYYKGYIKTSNVINLEDVWNGPELAKLKSQIENDIPLPGCQRCYDAEAEGLESRRTGAKKLYEEFHKDLNLDLDGPQGLDYSVGNLCNLKCVICHPNNSTNWIPDYKKLFPLKDMSVYEYEKFNQIEITDAKILKNIKNLHFHGGGDPLLSNNHLSLLERIDEVADLKNVRVSYNINGTKIVNNSILKIWEKCNLIEIYFSIDDIGNRFNYQRTNADWNEVTKNLNWYYNNMPHNHMFKINCTWGYLNLFYLDELFNWYKESFSQNRYGDPTELIFQKAVSDYAIDYLSKDLHKILDNKFLQYPEIRKLLNLLSYDDRPHTKFWNSINKLDQIRNTNFRSIFPEWSELLS